MYCVKFVTCLKALIKKGMTTRPLKPTVFLPMQTFETYEAFFVQFQKKNNQSLTELKRNATMTLNVILYDKNNYSFMHE